MTIKWKNHPIVRNIRNWYTQEEYDKLRKKAKKIENKEDYKPSKENWS